VELTVLVGAGPFVGALTHPRRARVALERSWIGLVSAATVLACLTGCPLWVLIAGPQHASGLIPPYWFDSGYRAESAALVAITPVRAVDGL